MSQTILVTGATGAVGLRVVQALCLAGYRICVFSTHAPKEGLFPQDVKTVLGDITDKIAVRSAMEGVDRVIHLAALLHIVSPSPDLEEQYERINVGGTKNVVEAAVETGVERVVLFSTIAAYGNSGGRILTEMSPTYPVTFYAKTKRTSEQIVLKARNAAGKPLGTVLRFGAIYGSNMKGNYKRLTRALASHLFIPVGSGLNRRTLIYEKDAGRAVAQAVFHPAAAGRLFNVTDGEFHTMKKIIEAICFGFGRKPNCLSLPIEPLRTLVRWTEKSMHAVGLKSPVTREMIDKYTEDIAMDGSLFQREIGFSPQYDLKTGWEETISEMYS